MVHSLCPPMFTFSCLCMFFTVFLFFFLSYPFLSPFVTTDFSPSSSMLTNPSGGTCQSQKLMAITFHFSPYCCSQYFPLVICSKTPPTKDGEHKILKLRGTTLDIKILALVTRCSIFILKGVI